MRPVVPVRLVLASMFVFAALAASALPALASFPGTNGRIAVGTSGGGQTPGSIYTMAADGSDLQPLVTDPPRRAEPAWSPDGTKLAYRRGMPNNPPNLAVVNADGTDDHVLLPDGIGEYGPAWSPDGTKIAFTRNNNAGFVGTLWVVDAAGGPPTQLTMAAQGSNCCATWSPDGKRIVFTRDTDIWMMDADGANQVNLTNTAQEHEIEPDWSPDGSRIVFRWFAGADETLQIQIRTLHLPSKPRRSWSTTRPVAWHRIGRPTGPRSCIWSPRTNSPCL